MGPVHRPRSQRIWYLGTRLVDFLSLNTNLPCEKVGVERVSSFRHTFSISIRRLLRLQSAHRITSTLPPRCLDHGVNPRTLRLKSAQLSRWARGLCNTDFWYGNDPEIYTNSAHRVLEFTH